MSRRITETRAALEAAGLTVVEPEPGVLRGYRESVGIVALVVIRDERVTYAEFLPPGGYRSRLFIAWRPRRLRDDAVWRRLAVELRAAAA